MIAPETVFVPSELYVRRLSTNALLGLGLALMLLLVRTGPYKPSEDFALDVGYLACCVAFVWGQLHWKQNQRWTVSPTGIHITAGGQHAHIPFAAVVGVRWRIANDGEFLGATITTAAGRWRAPHFANAGAFRNALNLAFPAAAHHTVPARIDWRKWYSGGRVALLLLLMFPPALLIAEILERLFTVRVVEASAVITTIAIVLLEALLNLSRRSLLAWSARRTGTIPFPLLGPLLTPRGAIAVLLAAALFATILTIDFLS